MANLTVPCPHSSALLHKSPLSVDILYGIRLGSSLFLTANILYYQYEGDLFVSATAKV